MGLCGAGFVIIVFVRNSWHEVASLLSLSHFCRSQIEKESKIWKFWRFFLKLWKFETLALWMYLQRFIKNDNTHIDKLCRTMVPKIVKCDKNCMKNNQKQFLIVSSSTYFLNVPHVYTKLGTFLANKQFTPKVVRYTKELKIIACWNGKYLK